MDAEEFQYIQPESFNTEKHIEMLKNLLKLVETRFNLSSDEFNDIFKGIEKNQKWTETNKDAISAWLEKENL